MLPPITIVTTTYLVNDVRLRTAISTINSWERYLEYSEFIYLHVSDDGSDDDRVSTLFDAINFVEDVTYSEQSRQGVGSSLNKGFKKAFETSPLVLYAVDDWKLLHDFNITPWAQLLMEREDVGMVRLGPPHPFTSGKVEMFTDNWQGWGLRLNREGFAFGHRPALYHRRMIDAYGWFKEGCNALECERLYNEKFLHSAGPDIVLALPHPWQHIDSIELSSLEPK